MNNNTDRPIDAIRTVPERLERLSALIDGEIEAPACEPCCLHWREAVEVRERWHAYHLIGDVLRSDELACGATHGARFLGRLRVRLAAEPALPNPVPTGRIAARRHRGWLGPAAVAAGFVAVAGMLVVTRDPGADRPSPAEHGRFALSEPVSWVTPPLPANASTTVVNPSDAPPQIVVADGQLVRDLRLDRYLAAHKQFGGSSALGVPSGFLRNATLQAPAR